MRVSVAMFNVLANQVVLLPENIEPKLRPYAGSLCVLRVQSCFGFLRGLRASVVKNLLCSATARDGFSCFFVCGPTALGFALVPVLLAASEGQFTLSSPVSEIHTSRDER